MQPRLVGNKQAKGTRYGARRFSQRESVAPAILHKYSSRGDLPFVASFVEWPSELLIHRAENLTKLVRQVSCPLSNLVLVLL